MTLRLPARNGAIADAARQVREAEDHLAATVAAECTGIHQPRLYPGLKRPVCRWCGYGNDGSTGR